MFYSNQINKSKSYFLLDWRILYFSRSCNQRNSFLKRIWNGDKDFPMNLIEISTWFFSRKSTSWAGKRSEFWVSCHGITRFIPRHWCIYSHFLKGWFYGSWIQSLISSKCVKVKLVLQVDSVRSWKKCLTHTRLSVSRSICTHIIRHID